MREESEEVKANILAIATDEFAKKGFNGARVDEIAERTITSKRMIYYYYDSKETLFRAVLEQAYSKIRAHEESLHLEDLEPLAAIRELAGFTFDYHNNNPIFNRLVMIENIQNAEHLNVDHLNSMNSPIISKITDIYTRGVKVGLFRNDLTPVDIHMTMSALCFFHVSNRATFSKIFKIDMTSAEALQQRRNQIIDLIVRYVAKL
jgi:AcrR family transcriptional regulator